MLPGACRFREISLDAARGGRILNSLRRHIDCLDVLVGCQRTGHSARSETENPITRLVNPKSSGKNLHLAREFFIFACSSSYGGSPQTAH